MLREQLVQFLKKEFPACHPKFCELVVDELSLCNAKNSDYSGGQTNDLLGNFHRNANLLSQYNFLKENDRAALKYCLILLLKQVDAVFLMVSQNYEGRVENLSTRLQDVSVYAKIAQILAKEQSENRN